MNSTGKRFYPALQLGEFADGFQALQSVGITGHLAELCIAGMDDAPGEPAAYEAQFAGAASDVRTVLVLAPTERSTIALCYGYLDLVADTEIDAAMLAAQGIAEHLQPDVLGEPVELRVFELTSTRRPLQ